jgi:hypothetical protein
MTLNEYRTMAQDCLRQAHEAQDERDRPLWATLAQSWLLLAEQVQRVHADEEEATESADRAPALN